MFGIVFLKREQPWLGSLAVHLNMEIEINVAHDERVFSSSSSASFGLSTPKL